ncbi:MAG: AAA family ATPase, partial [Eisenbergiella massiliensis]|uniref:ATP-dependent nuclease n=1 Tax=Eisenbergiella massiliensis TaxID=1720294 RepID=UPI0023F185F8
MQLSKINIKNYRLLIDAELEVDPKTTLIVGRNNTAKTSCFSCIGNVLEGKAISFNDYPLLKREDFYTKIELFMEKKLSYEDLCKQIEVISIDFLVDYSLDDPDDNLGALSPFIIDVDVDTTTALIRAEYRLKTDEKTLRALLVSSYYRDGTFSPNEEAHDVLADNFGKLFGLTVYAINPNNMEDKQVKSQKELHDLFPFHAIPAERVLGEDDAHNSSLGSLISGFFDMSEADLDPEVAEEIKRLRTIVEKANKDVQKQSDEILSAVVNSSIGFGYPNIEELKLGVTTQLSIDDQIKNQTKLSYISGTANESLPSSHNGLGYKNLIKMEFLLAAFAKDIEKRGVACVPLLFIEEPESHMHPQMQTAFAMYLEKFLGKLSAIQIQTFLTSHSAHIANTMEFAKVRYAQKSNAGVIYKNLNTFAQANSDNVDFIRKYLTLTKCDLFFADKAIFVEGASERLLLPDMIEKCETDGVFGSCKYPL